MAETPAAGRHVLRSLLVLAACGCATVRDARLAQDPASAVAGERTPTAAEIGLATSGPLHLADALEKALAIHPSILRARHGEQSAAARVAQADGALLPRATASASKQYRDQKSTPGIPVEHRFQSLGFQVSWLAFDFGRNSALARKAAEDWLAAQADARSAEVDVAYGVRNAYLSLAKGVQLRDVARDAVTQFDVHLAQVREFVKAGTRIPYDETKAEVDLGGAKLTLVQVEDALLLAQANLASAMGLAETTDWTADASSELPPTPPTFDAAWEAARTGRPSLASAAAREQAASLLVDAQIAALYPQLSLGAGWSASGATFPLPWSWQAGPSLSWTPFDGFQNLASIDDAVASLKGARADRAAAEQQAWLDTRSAWLAIEDAARRLDLTALVVRSAEENARLAQGRFDLGKATAVDLTDAQQALTKARADDVQARADVGLARARLLKAIGTSGNEPREGAAPAGRDR